MDKTYYGNKYGIIFQNNKEALEHYNNIGKQKGYFMNAGAEIIYCKNINFDATYYKKKYNITGDAKLHWINTGFEKGYHINMCEERGKHITNCKCKFKNEKINNDNQCNLMTDKLESQIEHILNSVNANKFDTYENINKSDESSCDCSDCMNDNENTINTNICTIITSNITNIKNYLNMCKTHVNIILKLLKRAQKHIIIICDPTTNYIIYDASRIKIHKLIKEINKITTFTLYNNLPLFYNKKTTSIKFPLFFCGVKTVDAILEQCGGIDNNYFKISLVKISLSCLKLECYGLPLLEDNDVMTNNTNKMPSSKCPIGKKPPDTMYNGDYSKCWTAGYHTKLFDDAIYYVSMINTKLDNSIELLETKILLFDKIIQNKKF